MVPSRPLWRILYLVDFSGFVSLMFVFLALKPHSFSSLARKMFTIGLLESVALTVISAIAPWIGTRLLNLALIVVYSVTSVTALAFVLVKAGAKSAHL